MVAGKEPRFPGFDNIQHASRKSVVEYDETNPTATRAWCTIVGGALDEINLLDVVSTEDMTVAQFMGKNSQYTRRDQEALDAHAAYMVDRKDENRRAYNF